MLLKNAALPVVLLLAVGGFVRWQFPLSDSPDVGEVAATVKASARAESPVPASAAEAPESARGQTLARLAYAQGWNRELPPAMAAFRAWAERYRAAEDRAARVALEAEGLALAQARRPEMLNVIKTDPQRALAITVPAVVRQSLPPAVLAELETRVAGRGDYMLRPAGDPLPGFEGARPSLRRLAFIGGVTYTAHAYGRREGQLTKEGASLHGVTLDRQLALHESPYRVLEPGEIPATAAAAECPISDLAVAAPAAGAGVNDAALNFVEADGRIFEFCDGEGMSDTLEGKLTAAEDQPGPRVRAFSTVMGTESSPTTAAAPATPYTLGVKQVLVLRVDTSDFPGEPVTVAAAQAEMDNVVKPYLEAYSYGQTSTVGIVSPKVYRLPRTGASYALADEEAALHADAITAASADYNAANFDRVVVVHPRLSPTIVPGSLISYAGEALGAPGTKIVINGGTNIGSTTHELGHSYGVLHSNLWQVADGNPVSAAGTTVEYGDAYDMMGSNTYAFSGPRDVRHHFNMWQKNRLGWLPDAAVTTVTSSGTYRIYRFDSRSASLTQPLALRIFRDGVRWYWIGFRQSFTTNASLTNGAYVIWGFNNKQQSQLLDLTTPGTSTNDVALAVGSTFTDAAYGISIRPIARGDAEPAQYLDLEITVPTSPPSVVAAWGRDGVTFFAGNTGAVVNPAPETYVPFGLTGVSAIAAGDLHALALKPDGTVVAWGNNANGQITLPAGLANVASIAAGGNVSGVVKRDGTVQLWGESVGGVTTPPAGLTGVKQLAIGGDRLIGIYHALALKIDGTVVGWGSNSAAQLTVPAGLSNVVAVAASDRLSVALKADGTVVRWGVTFAGAIAFPTGLSGVTAIASSGGRRARPCAQG